MRFLHTVGWQIGCKYGQLDMDDTLFLVEEGFRAVERIAELAIDQAIQCGAGLGR